MPDVEIERAKRNWDRAQHAYQYYCAYIEEKRDKLCLSVTDLVYVKNFKGGSTTIVESPSTIGESLAGYEAVLREADGMPAFRKSLGELDDSEYESAEAMMMRFAGLRGRFPIKGFGVSFATALLHFYFPTLVPIVDRRVLNGASIDEAKVDGDGQVQNPLVVYPKLIKYFRARLREDRSLTLRSLDRQLFIEKLKGKFKKK
jgi:hypothetical protein